MSTERAGFREQTASTRPAARWQSESASEPMTRSRCATPRSAGATAAIASVVVPSSERISIVVLRAGPVERRAVQAARRRRAPRPTPRPRRSRRRSRTTTSSIVAPSATASEREKNGIPRFAFTEPSIGSTTTVSAPPAPKSRSPSSSETSVKSRPERLEAPHDGVLGRRVDRGRVVAALAGAEDRLALDARRQLGEHRVEVAHARAAERRASRSRVDGMEEEPREQLREEVRCLLRHRPPRRARAKTSSTRSARRRKAQSASPRSTGATASSRSGVYAEPLVPEAVDELDVELAPAPCTRRAVAAAHEDQRRVVSRALRRARRAPRRPSRATRRPDRCPDVP